MKSVTTARDAPIIGL